VFLVDTDVLSLAAPTKARPSAALAAWLEARSGELFLSSVTIAEIVDGIARCRREGALRKAERLEAWLDTLVHLYAGRVLPMHVDVAKLVGTLRDLARGRGHTAALADRIVAATARHHGLTVVTGNVRHFAPLGVAVVDAAGPLP
jgi:predicted nucleic acid-binding protein